MFNWGHGQPGAISVFDVMPQPVPQPVVIVVEKEPPVRSDEGKNDAGAGKKARFPLFIKKAARDILNNPEQKLTVTSLARQCGQQRGNLYKTYGIDKQSLQQLEAEILAEEMQPTK